MRDAERRVAAMHVDRIQKIIRERATIIRRINVRFYAHREAGSMSRMSKEETTERPSARRTTGGRVAFGGGFRGAGSRVARWLVDVPVHRERDQ